MPLSVVVLCAPTSHSPCSCVRSHSPAVEAELRRALCANGIIELNDPALKWSRCSRTDRGVHALRNNVSARVRLPKTHFDDCRRMLPHHIAAINAALPQDIRVLSAVRPRSTFDAQMSPFARSYKYYVPLAAVGDDLALFRTAIATYRGNHYFQNFTVSQVRRSYVVPLVKEGVPEAKDDSDFGGYPEHLFDTPQLWKVDSAAARTVYDATVDVDETTFPGEPMAVVTLTASSFMMHQVRHMVGLAIAVSRGIVPLEYLHAALTMPRFPGTTLSRCLHAGDSACR